jgi:hypothetical protein
MEPETLDQIPVLFGHFEDGIYVTATNRELEPILWAKLISIDDVPIAEVYDKVATITPQDNPLRVKATGPQFFRHPPVLKGLGIAKSRNEIHVRSQDRTGVTREVTLTGEHSSNSDWVREPAGGNSPISEHFKKRSDLYWMEYDPTARVVLFQYNGVSDKEGGESIEQFASRLKTFLAEKRPSKLIVDLRFNGGGNNFLNVPLLNAIAGSDLNRPGSLYVLQGRFTCSAAICFAGELERYTKAIFVGEPTPSQPNFIGENANIRLPCTGLKGSISNLSWQNAPAMDARVWIAPKIYVPYLFSDWKSGRDAAYEAAVND